MQICNAFEQVEGDTCNRFVIPTSVSLKQTSVSLSKTNSIIQILKIMVIFERFFAVLLINLTYSAV